jgi:hypothetical protein
MKSVGASGAAFVRGNEKAGWTPGLSERRNPFD